MYKIIFIPIRFFENMFTSFGEYIILISKIFKSPKEWKDYTNLTFEQMMVIGTNSIPIVILTAIFSGMVTSVQSAYQFESWTPTWFVGSIVGESILLELAPVISALVLTGRVGATIAAEIGTMRVTEQIDAIESLSFNPVLYLVFPRIVAGVFMFPILVIIASFFGIFGGWFSATMSMEVTTYDFFKGFKTWFHPFDAFLGIIKSIFFGFTITSIACFQGYKTQGGAQGVGEATTVTVVASCVMIVVLDYIISALLL
tara:strand:+ start:812 stop:1582 length:771 start_codon:yes stop_codon:yes gene_type:complete